jgi:transcriptional regulator with XRE-family HTH domain
MNMLAAYQKKQGLTLQELADKIGVSRGRASEYVNDVRTPGPRVARRISEVTGQPWWKYVAAPESGEVRA